MKNEKASRVMAFCLSAAMAVSMVGCAKQVDKTPSKPDTPNNDSNQVETVPEVSEDIDPNAYLALTANATTGFEWVLTPEQEGIVSISSEYIAPESSDTELLGASGVTVLTFKPESAGTVKVNMEYKQPFDEETPAANGGYIVITVAPNESGALIATIDESNYTEPDYVMYTDKLELPSNPSTGYEWHVQVLDESIVTITSEYKSAEELREESAEAEEAPVEETSADEEVEAAGDDAAEESVPEEDVSDDAVATMPDEDMEIDEDMLVGDEGLTTFTFTPVAAGRTTVILTYEDAEQIYSAAIFDVNIEDVDGELVTSIVNMQWFSGDEVQSAIDAVLNPSEEAEPEVDTADAQAAPTDVAELPADENGAQPVVTEAPEAAPEK